MLSKINKLSSYQSPCVRVHTPVSRADNTAHSPHTVYILFVCSAIVALETFTLIDLTLYLFL